MSKNNKSVNNKESKFFIPEERQNLVFSLLLVILVIAFFSPAIFGNGFGASDNLASKSFETYLNNASQKGEFPLWNPHIFSGMPSYASLLTTGDRWWDIAPKIVFGVASIMGWLFNNDVARVIFYYIVYALGLYFFTSLKTSDKTLGFLSAVAGVFATGVVIWVMIGHNTKPVVFSFVPWVFYFLEKIKLKFSFIYAVFLAIVLHLMFEGGHLQMIFYSFLLFGIYFLFEIIVSIKDKQFNKLLISLGVFILGVGIAFSLSSDRYLSTLEYKQYSVRGKGPIIKNEKNKQAEDGGNDYDYATMWSFSPGEMMDFLVPNYHGYGKLPYNHEKPENQGTILAQISQNQGGTLPTYWGQKPMEDAPPYMGIIIIFLAIIGIKNGIKTPFVQFLTVASVFALLLSFGYTFPIIYDLFFYNFPNFSTFRAPSMVLVILHFTMPILAVVGIKSIFDKRQEYEGNSKKLIIDTIGLPILFLGIGLIFTLIFESSYREAIASSNLPKMFPQEYAQQILTEMQDFIWSSTVSDWYIGGFLSLIALGAIYLSIKKSLNYNVVFSIVLILIVIDLWRVDYRAFDVPESKLEEQYFSANDWADYLKTDKSVYRVADFVSPSPNIPAYYDLQTINGYHAAKLRVYQDMLDVAAGGSTSQVNNPFLWKLMNAKYIIAPSNSFPGQPLFQSNTGAAVYLNDNYLERAFFVDSVGVDKGINILEKMKFQPGVENFDPMKVAFLEKELPFPIYPVNREKSYAKITEYKNESIKLEVETDKTSLLFLSEVYYPAGWKAYIDGKETEIYKTNFTFRSIVINQGKHKIEFKFVSDKFETGKSLSLASNVFLVVLLGLGIFLDKRKKGN